MSTVKSKAAAAARAAAAAVATPVVAAPVVAAAEAAPAADVAPAVEVAEAAVPLAEPAVAGKDSIDVVMTASADAVMTASADAVMTASADAVVKGYEKAVAVTKEQVDAAAKVHTAAFRSYEDAVSIGRDNLEALVRAGGILSRGLQDIGRMMIGLTQDAVDDSVAISKQMMAARTLKEVVDLQSSLVRSGLDKVLEDGTRLSDLSVRLAEETFAPIGERFNATVDRLVSAA